MIVKVEAYTWGWDGEERVCFHRDTGSWEYTPRSSGWRRLHDFIIRHDLKLRPRKDDLGWSFRWPKEVD